MLTKAEKESRVIELYEDNKNYREIAREVHMSLSDISSIVKKHTGEDGMQLQAKAEQLQQQKTVEVRAFTLFEAGRSPIQIAIELNLKSEDVIRLNKEWWQLRGLDKLNRVYEEIGDNIFSLVTLYNSTKTAGMGQQQIINALSIAEQLPSIEKKYRTLRNEVSMLEFKEQRLEHYLHGLNSQITAAKVILNSCNESIVVKNRELANLEFNKHELENFIAKLKTDNKEYHRVARIARENVCQILNDKRMILYIALVSILEALKEDPETQFVIYDFLDAPANRIPSVLGLDSRQYRDLFTARLLQIALKVYNKLLNICENRAMSPAAPVETQKR